MNLEIFTEQLRSAANERNLLVMKALVKDLIDSTDSSGQTAAYIAAKNGDVEMLKYLANFGADFLTTANNGSTPLSIAAHEGHVNAVQYFIEERGMQALANPTLLFIAARNGSTEVVQYLMKEGRLVDVKNVQSMTDDAMEMAARNGHTSVVNFLSDLGARKDISLLIAAQEGRVEVLSYLIDQKGMDRDTCHPYKYDGATPLALAAKNGQLSAVQYLVGKGAEKAKANAKGWNALHFAAAEGHLDVMQYLVEQEGADKEAKSKDGDTALHLAAKYACNRWNGREAMVNYLVQQGAKTNITNRHNISPLGIAAQHGNFEVVQYLVEVAGAQLEDRYSPPLFLAAENGNLAIVQYLCALGGGVVNFCCAWYGTPIFIAAANGHLDVVLHLAANDADVNKAKDDGWTPLHIAAKKGHTEIVTCLLSWGADLTAKINSNEQLPIDVAANDAIRQLIRDEEERRRNHGFKRAVVPPSSPVEDEDEGEEPDSKRRRLDSEGTGQAMASATTVAEEEEDSDVTSEQQTQ